MIVPEISIRCKSYIPAGNSVKLIVLIVAPDVAVKPTVLIGSDFPNAYTWIEYLAPSVVLATIVVDLFNTTIDVMSVPTAVEPRLIGCSTTWMSSQDTKKENNRMYINACLILEVVIACKFD
jgi:hypothetical protein